MEYDVIVVGAGPAGAAAAYWLGEIGRRVLVLEKERLPRYKPCGGGSSRATLARFPFDFSSVVEREVSCFRVRFRDGREIRAALTGPPLVMMMRDRFDAHILHQARAEVLDRSPVESLRQDGQVVEVATCAGETFHARYLIGADGANSRVARLAGLWRKRRLGVALEAEVPADGRLMAEYAETALFLLGALPWGYLWVFPKSDHLSVGCGTFLSRCPGMRERLRREMERLGIEIGAAPLRGHPIPIYQPRAPLCQGRVLLAGDAAGLVDPLLGEGIRYAVESARLAVEAVVAGDVAAYTRRVHREIGADLRWGRLWARLFFDHPRASFELVIRNARFLEAFLGMMAGQTTYRRILACIPFYLLEGIGRRLPADPVGRAQSGGNQSGDVVVS